MNIGVVIPAFNVALWMRDAIRSVLSQTHSRWSLVIVDDGSTDTTAEIAATFHDPRVTLIRQANSGVSIARNHGLVALKADAFLFLDADDWLAPDALAVLSATLADCPSAVAAASGYARITAGGSTRQIAAPPSGALLRRLLVRNLFANGGHLLIRREAIEVAGGFNPSLSYGEDWEYWTRLALQGNFVSVRSSAPLMFVRERLGSAYHRMAIDPARFVPSMDAVYGNPAMVARFGLIGLAQLRRRAEAENMWVVGREMIRHLHQREGQAWLVRSLRRAPGLKRLGLLGLSSLKVGPFRPYAACSRRISQPIAAAPRAI